MTLEPAAQAKGAKSMPRHRLTSQVRPSAVGAFLRNAEQERLAETSLRLDHETMPMPPAQEPRRRVLFVFPDAARTPATQRSCPRVLMRLNDALRTHLKGRQPQGDSLNFTIDSKHFFAFPFPVLVHGQCPPRPLSPPRRTRSRHQACAKHAANSSICFATVTTLSPTLAFRSPWTLLLSLCHSLKWQPFDRKNSRRDAEATEADATNTLIKTHRLDVSLFLMVRNTVLRSTRSLRPTTSLRRTVSLRSQRLCARVSCHESDSWLAVASRWPDSRVATSKSADAALPRAFLCWSARLLLPVLRLHLQRRDPLSLPFAFATIGRNRFGQRLSFWRSCNMRPSHRQKSLFRDGWPSWSWYSEEQQRRLVELLAELFVDHLDRLRPVEEHQEPKPRKETPDA